MLVVDRYTRLKFKSNMAGLMFLILASIYFAVWSSWLYPTFPYPGVAWNGVPWVNFWEWIAMTIFVGAIDFYILAWRAKLNKDIRDIYGEKKITETVPSGEKSSITASEARMVEIAEEVYEDRKNKGGG